MVEKNLLQISLGKNHDLEYFGGILLQSSSVLVTTNRLEFQKENFFVFEN